MVKDDYCASYRCGMGEIIECEASTKPGEEVYTEVAKKIEPKQPNKVTNRVIVQAYVPANVRKPIAWSFHVSEKQARQIQQYAISLMTTGEETT